MFAPNPIQLAVLVLAAALAWTGSAHSAPPPAIVVAAGDANANASTPPATGTDAWRALDPAALDRLRGGDGAESNVVIDGLVDGNTADHVITGDNLLDGGAFGHASGINTVIQNSGSNVLIQSGTAVSVQFSSPTP
ncbi:hypothetical protein [Marilutibacter aestuarii]|uniref:Uncharacterized protein n=1 Tax=Marilutibacter aestuarii TaxID=1706195 RepID=A0A508A8X6_9GAMM|nr:hypothetical protein [Lysobacter aestuarii]TQD46320.1 hypothetical protein FKV25_06630 [Lysobacter aestuarii]